MLERLGKYDGSGNVYVADADDHRVQQCLDLAAENNWWGTTDDGSIQGLIYDWFDQASLGILDYTPFLTQANGSAPSWSP